jgi:hypothetical protein
MMYCLSAISFPPQDNVEFITDKKRINKGIYLGNNFWKLDITVTESGVGVEGVCVVCTNQTAFVDPPGYSFKCAVTDHYGKTYMIFVGQEGVDYYDNWTFKVCRCSEFCCCDLEGEQFGMGCITYVCPTTNQNLCELSLGGVWTTQSKCNLQTGTCGALTIITLSDFEATGGDRQVTIL